MPGCQDAWMLKIDDLLVKNVQLHFSEFSSHQIGTIFKSFALTFQSASTSLVPLKIVQVELEKHGFKFKTYENPKT